MEATQDQDKLVKWDQIKSYKP